MQIYAHKLKYYGILVEKIFFLETLFTPLSYEAWLSKHLQIPVEKINQERVPVVKK